MTLLVPGVLMDSSGLLLNAPVAADENCFGCRMLSTKQSGEVLGLLLRTYPNIEAVNLYCLTLYHPGEFLCCLVSLSTLRMVSSDTARLALKASTMFLNDSIDGGIGFAGASDPQLLSQ